MNYINFKEANCKNCYKCLRNCPVKAIKFENQQAEIVEERCVSCGHCLEICPQNARYITSNLDIVKNALLARKKLVASIAPSFPAYMDMEPSKVIAALKGLGFSVIEETALGAEMVLEEYMKFVDKNAQNNYITTSCPSINTLVEKYYPELIKYLMPVVSPMIAHGRRLKRIHGENSYVVFIGPCVGKKLEANEFRYERIIDAVLTFEELNQWIKEKKRDIYDIKEEYVEGTSFTRGKVFPISGGIIKGMKKDINKKFDFISVTGIEECMELFESMKLGDIENKFIEVSACKGSCIGGPSRFKNKIGYYDRLNRVVKYLNEDRVSTDNGEKRENIQIDLSRKFEDKRVDKSNCKDEKIKEILRSMGKYSKDDELNCGVCGYDTCKDKAKAIFEGMAETDMCLHFMRTKAESLANVIIENTENIIILVDKEMKIVTVNPATERVFLVKDKEITGKSLSLFINDEDFKEVSNSRKNIIGKKVYYPEYNAMFIENIMCLEKQNMVLASMINITEEEQQKEELSILKSNTLDAAQEVIEKQMRVAQEIAGLLGETTAETKVILTQLKKLVAGEK